MAKDKLTDYDSTAANNLDVGGISVAEGMLPSGVNNAIRELMSHQAEAFGAGTPLYVDQTNNRLGVGTSSPDRSLHIASSEPTVVFENTGQGTDLKTWRIYSNSSSLQIGTVDDAFSSGQNALEITRDNTDNITGIQFKTGASSEIARFTTDGLTFNGDTAAANALDDYEEGTWTPVVASGTVTYTTQRGRYTKIGRVVHIHFFVQIASISGSSSTDIISGLPFAAKNDSNYTALASKTNNYNWGGSSTMIAFQVRPNTSNISAAASGNNQAFIDVSSSGISAGTWIAASGHYITDA